MAGGLFILPGVIALMALSNIYAEWGKVGYVEALFFGLKAAVLAIVVEALIRIGKRALEKPSADRVGGSSLRRDFLLRQSRFHLIIVGGLIGYGSGAGR